MTQIKPFSPSLKATRVLLVATSLSSMPFWGIAQAQVPYGLTPLPTVAGVPFHPNVFGAAATEAQGSSAPQNKPIPGMPKDSYMGHASVVLWADENGETRYSAAVALHSIVFGMSLDGCRKENGGSDEKCKEVYDAPTPALAVIKASDGGFFFVNGSNQSDAKKKGMEACARRANVTCQVDKAFGERGGLFGF